MSEPGRHRAWLLAGLAALLAAVFPGLLRGEVFFDRDVLLWWSAQAESFRRVIGSGAAPWWDPYTGFGQPMAADPSFQVWYPPTWLTLLLDPLRYYVLYAAAHLLLGALGMQAFARRRGLSPAASSAAAAFFLLSGPFLSLVNYWNHLAGIAWMPWIAAALEDVRDRGHRRDVLRLAALGAVQVATGSPDSSLLTAVLGLALLLAHMRSWRAPAISRLARAAAGAIALSAVVWLPALVLAQGAGRLALPEMQRARWSLSAIALWQALIPVLTARLSELMPYYTAHGDTLRPYLASIYVGLGCVVLALVALMVRERPRGTVTLAVLAAAGAVLALGSHTAVYPLVVRALPPLALMRFPAKWMLLVAFALAVLAATGLDAVARAAGRSRAVALACGVGLVAATGAAAWRVPAVFSAWAADKVEPDRLAAFTSALGPLQAHAQLAVALGAVVCLLLAAQWSARRDLTVVLAGVVVLDLVLAHHGLVPTLPHAVVAHRPAALAALAGAPSPRVYVWDYVFGADPSRSRFGAAFGRPRPPLAIAYQEYLLPPSGARWGVRSSFDLDKLGLQTSELRRLAQILRGAEDTPGYLRLLQLGAVDHVLALHDQGEHGLLTVGRVDRVWAEPIHVAAVPFARPRVYAVGAARHAEGDAARELLLDPGLDPAREVVLAPFTDAPAAQSVQARILVDRADRLEAETTSDGPAVLVDVDALDRWWRAEVDGAPAPVRLANTAFRAVAVPAGTHRVSLRYRPVPVLAGLALSLAAWAAWLVLAIRRAPPPRSP